MCCLLSIVGFTELSQDDQIKLIKQGSFEVILARYVPLFTDKGMFVPDMSVRVPVSVSFKVSAQLISAIHNHYLCLGIVAKPLASVTHLKCPVLNHIELFEKVSVYCFAYYVPSFHS